MSIEKACVASNETSIKAAVDNSQNINEQYDVADFVEIERNEACLQHGDGGVNH
ncbi:hypothetical protein [Pseudomonas chlororaphis]|uniref:hypothetical protein n=1 Tax=Pseudomonas chlororaphis TaxID=587753 RepID=UPI0007BC4548|nr:hypothetical protein [Pseudomonas chlororaphis]AZC62912.1 hypothetical protein C4K33_2420 [Pseudomonas chlororaphis subsp. piscium]AZC69148.1 hypothetical protein C4K32_2486 [Pseudomonas chlororaphis subsp. piscium]AZC88802.1 hypothetical protein C4K29_2501 [Pseudomonas chlororaphis subsp. piscium]AZD54269.1 hypothetical protein C4K19_2482 [Pseudomonas chlororaphis subsp. aurantiaca]KZO49246.1 hypothetical protein PCL1391_2201 [Pseudomonas chlororaphis subsp. piscium]